MPDAAGVLPETDDLFLVQMGGLGDLVLLAEPAAALRRARPAGRLVLLCRQAVAAAASLWPVPPDEVIALDLDPQLWDAPAPALEHALAGVAALLAGRRAVAVIDAAARSGWFGGFAGAVLQAGQVITCPGAPEPPRDALLHLMLLHFDIAARDMQQITVRPRLHERERHRHWLAACGIGAIDAAPWRVAPPLHAAAQDWLAKAGLAPGAYLACAPGGAASTKLKRWPERRFVDVLRQIGLPVLLLGAAAEQEQLARIAAALEGLPTACLASAPHALSLTGALLALARGWLANDSGPMHLAQAYGVPGVAIFGGGGRWPSYAPWAPGAIGVVCPLPCFGCDWDCLLDHALCIESVEVAAVVAALRRALAAPTAAPDIVSVAGPAAPVWEILADASDSYRAAQRDRTQRLETMLEGVLREKRHAQLLAEQGGLLAEQERVRAEQARAIAAFTEAFSDRTQRVAALEEALGDRGRRIAALEATQGSGLCAYQISIGLGAGNIGDELMANAFWQHLPDGLTLEVPLFPMADRQRAGYPARHRYTAVDWQGNENAAAEMPGLLVGATPVTEAEGLDWPLRFLAPRLLHFHRRGWAVDALGVGVEPLATPEAKALFAEAFLPIRSWTVRSAACRDALLALGVAPAAVKVGADWGWLATPRRDLRDWAASWLRRHRIDPTRPLLLANVVNMLWRDREVRQAIAAGLDAAAERHGLQVAFLCNECRDGEFFDRAAAEEIVARMRARALVLPNAYYAPDEAVALLRHADVTVGQRYHFIVESVLAGTVPIGIPRGAKMRDLAAELGIAEVGSVEGVSAVELATALDAALAERPARLLALAQRQRDLAMRAAGNFDLLRTLPPYAPLWRATQ